MTSYEFGNLVLVPFPFTDLEGLKKRPALVLNSYHSSFLPPLSLVAMVTSEIEGEMIKGDYLLQQWQESGLLHPSRVRLAKMVTIEKEVILKRIGQLHQQDQGQIKGLFQKIFQHILP